jgi:hypothetical protein
MSQGEIFLTDRLKDCSWFLSPRQSVPFGRRGGQVITYGQPYWSAQFRYENLDEAGLRAMSAWIARREGARYTFTAYRPTRKLPASGLASNSGVGIASISTINSTVSLTGLSTNAMVPGDMVSYYTAALGYYCGEIVSVGTLSGGAQTVTVRPAPVTVNVSTPDVRVVEAVCEYQLDGEVRISEPYDRRYAVSFAARQVERA